MNSNNLNYNAYLDYAAKAIAADDRELARGCIEAVLAETNDRVEAWLMKAWTCDSMQETEVAIQRALEIDPENEFAVAGLTWTHGIRKLAELQLETKRQAEEEAQRQAEEEARLAAEEEAQRQAEEEARLAAEEEAQRQAEEEARLAAEEEAQRQAEEEARLAAEEEARLAAEEKAQRQAEEEAQRQAEEEAQRQDEEEARLAIEEEARLAAEAVAQRQAEEEAQRHAEEARLELEAKYQAEFERQAEIERQTQTTEAEEKNLAEQQSDLSSQAVDGGCDSPEIELKDNIDAFAQEVRNEIESIENANSTQTSAEVDLPKKQVVLAVDDSPTVRKLVSLTLSREGFEVITAADGIEALNILSEQLPDIILTDINMPKLNGYKLCKFVKKHERTQSIPVVMLSGKDGVFDKMRGKLSGCDDFVIKPFESEELVAKVRETLSAVASN